MHDKKMLRLKEIFKQAIDLINNELVHYNKCIDDLFKQSQEIMNSVESIFDTDTLVDVKFVNASKMYNEEVKKRIDKIKNYMDKIEEVVSNAQTCGISNGINIPNLSKIANEIMTVKSQWDEAFKITCNIRNL